MSWRRTAVALVAVAIVACAVARGAAGGWLPGRDPARPGGHPAQRRALLVDLRSRLIPSAAGGWVVAEVGEPSLALWLLAASQSGDPAAFSRSLVAAERQLDRGEGEGERDLALVLAEVLPGPSADRGRADRLASAVLRRALDRLDQDPSWLAPLLQLSAGSSPSSEAATEELARRAGSVGCGRLPAPGAALPEPGTSLTVALRVLAGTGKRCPAAVGVLERALDDPAWKTWIAADELTALAQIGGRLPGPTRRALAARFDEFTAVGPDRPIDLGGAVAVARARRVLGLPAPDGGPLARHIEGQVRHRGGLPGRSTLAPTTFDVAVLRQLVGSGMLPVGSLRSTREVAAWPDVSGPLDPLVSDLLGGDARLRCGDASKRRPSPARVSFGGVIAQQARATVRAACSGHLDVAAEVRRLRSERDPALRPVRIAAAELAACRIDPALLDQTPGMRLRASGPFAHDPIVEWAGSVAADPTAACAAVRRA